MSQYNPDRIAQAAIKETREIEGMLRKLKSRERVYDFISFVMLLLFVVFSLLMAEFGDETAGTYFAICVCVCGTIFLKAQKKSIALYAIRKGSENVMKMVEEGEL